MEEDGAWADFCAWLLIWMMVLLPMWPPILFQSLSYRDSASMKRVCSAVVQVSRGFDTV